MLDIQNSCLVVVDVQGKLAQIVHESQNLIKQVQILVKTAKILDIPIIWCQQCPNALGPTVEEIADLLTDLPPIDKASFSCCTEQFNSKLKSLNRHNVILCGIETHVCVYQTAADLLAKNYSVNLIADAVSSRTLENKQIAIERLRSMGVSISSVEMVLFELLKTAEHPKFRDIAKLIK